MEIGVVTHTVAPGDGQGRANYEIIRYALKQGVRVRVVADHIAPDLLDEGVVFFPVTIAPQLRRINLVKVALFAKAADKRIGSWERPPNILHSYGYCTSLPHDINTSQYVHTAWNKSPYHTARVNRNAYGAYHWLYSTCNSRWEHKAYHQARIVVAASGTVREELKTLIGVPEERLRVINNGADTTEFYPLPEGETRDRASLKLPQGVVLGLFAGDLRTPRKNLDSVLKAMQTVPDLHLAVVGKLDNSPYPAMAEQLGLAARVHFLGFRKDIASIMRAVDFFVFPSRYEACALVLSEAAASGLPIITAHTTGGSEVVATGAGIMIEDPNDVRALCQSLRDIAQVDIRTKMRTIARRQAAQQSWEKIGKAYFDLYTEIAR